MNIPDLIAIIGNVSQSLFPMQHLISGAAYLLGLLFIIKAISKFRKIGDHRAQSHSQEKMFTPIMYLLFGAALIFLPTALGVMANTAFGTGNVLTYAPYNQADIYSTIGLLIHTVGILWFVRGCVLIAHSSEPGTQEGPKGLVFLVSGILAMNFDNTVAMVNSIIVALIKFSVKYGQGS